VKKMVFEKRMSVKDLIEQMRKELQEERASETHAKPAKKAKAPAKAKKKAKAKPKTKAKKKKK